MDKALPLHTIYDKDGKPYLSIIHDEKIIKIQLHSYDEIYSRGIFMTIDRRAIPELIRALEQVEDWWSTT